MSVSVAKNHTGCPNIQPYSDVLAAVWSWPHWADVCLVCTGLMFGVQSTINSTESAMFSFATHVRAYCFSIQIQQPPPFNLVKMQAPREFPHRAVSVLASVVATLTVTSLIDR